METRERCRRALALCVSIAAAVALLSSGVFADTSAATSKKQTETETPKPSERATPDLVPFAQEPVIDIETVWSRPLGPRGAGCTHDNGLPLEDFGDPASQLSQDILGAPMGWRFVAAAADDFEFIDLVNPGVNCQITNIRAAFMFFGPESAEATPGTTWQSDPYVAGEGGITITVYANSLLNSPSGEPTMTGGHNGIIIATRFISTDDLIAADAIEGPSGTCRSVYTIDMDLTGQEITVAKNTVYWLSLVPRFPATPQSAWCLSDIATQGFHAQHGSSFGTPFWDVIDGNSGLCAEAPAAGTHKELAFQLTAQELPATTGACCNTATSVCVDVLDPADCVGADEVFSPGTLCVYLDPPCSEGACCYPDGFGGGICVVTTEAECFDPLGYDGFKFVAGETCPINCAPPPPNDNCADAFYLTGPSRTVAFDTTGATVEESAPTTTCGDVAQDVWYDYQVPNAGTVIITTEGSGYDTMLAVYGPGAGACPDASLCPVADDSEIACNDDYTDVDPGNTLSLVMLPVSGGECLKIRVGGKDLGLDISGGAGFLHIDCVPTGYGACCHLDRDCDDFVLEADCQEPGDHFTLGAVCSDLVCPPAPDNDDCVSAIPLTDASVSVEFNTTFATTDESGPTTLCGDVVQDVWYSWVASCDGTAVIHTLGSSYDTSVAVYDFSSGAICPDDSLCAGLAALELACNDDLDAGETISKLFVPVSAGDCLMIRVGGKDIGLGLSGGAGVLNIDCAPTGTGACCHVDRTCDDAVDPVDCVDAGDVFTLNDVCSELTCPSAPDHDLCADAAELAGTDIEVSFDTTYATTDTDAAITNCGVIVQDVWYSYKVPCTGTVVISTVGSEYDTAIAVYGPSIGGDCPDAALCPLASPSGDLTEAACHDDMSTEILTSEIVFAANVDDCLLIRVGGKDIGLAASGGVGTLKIDCVPSGLGACCHIDRSCDDGQVAGDCVDPGDVFSLGNVCSDHTCPPAPENDECVAAALLTGDAVTVEFDTTYATTPTDAAMTTCGAIVQDVWYSYEATCDGRLVITTEGSAFDTILAVYAAGSGASCFDGAWCPEPSPAGDDTELACSNNVSAWTLTSSLMIGSVVTGDCFFIRVGGQDVGLGVSGGKGTLTVDCIPTGYGACCHFSGGCDVTLQADCNLSGDSWFEGEPCLVSVCHEFEPTPECCLGDMNDDGFVNGLDIQPFMEAVIDAMPSPTPGTFDFCHADMNMDNVLDMLDVPLFVDELVYGGGACAIVCCAGDMNGDTILDELDRPLLQAAIASPPAAGTLAFCRTDVDVNGMIDADDEAEFDLLLATGATCSTGPSCCVGDLNDDGRRNGEDVRMMIDVLMSPPLAGSEAFCRADANGDWAVDTADIQPFVDRLLDGTPCP